MIKPSITIIYNPKQYIYNHILTIEFNLITILLILLLFCDFFFNSDRISLSKCGFIWARLGMQWNITSTVMHHITLNSQFGCPMVQSTALSFDQNQAEHMAVRNKIQLHTEVSIEQIKG